MDDILIKHKEFAESYVKNRNPDAINYLNLQELQNIVNTVQ
jgi:hypothetical protein